MNRRKRVQVGWYCNHEDEPWDNRSHVKESWQRGRKNTASDSSTVKSLQFLDHEDPKKQPPCPLSEPIYVYRKVESDAN